MLHSDIVYHIAWCGTVVPSLHTQLFMVALFTTMIVLSSPGTTVVLHGVTGEKAPWQRCRSQPGETSWNVYVMAWIACYTVGLGRKQWGLSGSHAIQEEAVGLSLMHVKWHGLAWIACYTVLRAAWNAQWRMTRRWSYRVMSSSVMSSSVMSWHANCNKSSQATW